MNNPTTRAMKLYVLTGYMPDTCECNPAMVSEVFTSEADALLRLMTVEKELKTLLIDECKSTLKDFKLSKDFMYHNEFILARLTAEVTLDAESALGAAYLWQFSPLRSVCPYLSQSDVKISDNKLVFRITDLTIKIKSLTIETTEI